MTAGRHQSAARALSLLLVAAIAFWMAHMQWNLGADTFFNEWLYNGVIAGCVVLAAWRGLASREDRVAWLLIALGLAAWLAGDVWWVIHENDNLVPIPSLADWLYFAMYPPMTLAIILLIRKRVGRLSGMLALDGFIGACAIAALSAALVLEPVLDTASGTATALAVTVAYPVLDIVLVGLLIEAVALGGWMLSRGWALLGVGLAGFAVTDGVYYAQVARDTYGQGGLVDLGWLVSMLLIGLAAWQPEPRIAKAKDMGWRQLVAPGLFAALAVGVAAYAYAADINALAMTLTCFALIAVIVRMVATFRENLMILAAAQQEALTDSLTGLSNRRRLVADLDDRLCDGGRHVLLLCDLNGFKRYNDTYGHPAGDALLNRLGARLACAVAAHGRAYRMGGDEFCALLGGSMSAAEALSLVGAALAEHGEGFEITASCGAVALPLEASVPTEALRLADTRMYEQKRGGRTTAETQSVELLMRLLSERDPRLSDHVTGVARLAVAVAERLGLPAGLCEDVRVAAALHDVGKLAIPDSILDKPGPLDDDEWAFMCRHTLIGERILESTPALAGVAVLVRASHERPDGSGYPDGLAGDAIPFGARIVAVCDAYDAMVSDRPYRRGMAPDAALRELRRGAGTQFDPAVVDAFVAEQRTRTLATAA